MTKRFPVLIPAAGTGQRFGGFKQLTKIGGKTILERAVEPFFDLDFVSEIIVLLPENLINTVKESLFLNCDNTLKILKGGNNRAESVFIGLQAVEDTSEVVIIHDGARPWLKKELILRVVDRYLKGDVDAVVCALSSVDTIKEIDDNGFVLKTLDRSRIYHIQTPQLVNVELYKKGYNILKKQLKYIYDDAQCVEAAGGCVAIVQGDPENVKVTYKGDVMKQESRIFLGYDFHNFSKRKDGSLKLFGLTFSEKMSVEAHSDGDVALHALCDAMLAAVGKDIGELFPDTDNKNRNRDSVEFVHDALLILKEKRLNLLWVDFTVIADVPKISPLKQKAKENLSKLLSIEPSRITIKSKTWEKRGVNGIAVYCLCAIDGYYG